MRDSDLSKLKRDDLLTILIGQQKQIQDLTEALEAAEQALNDRRIQLNEAGSIAEAALRLNGVFDAAQRAVDDYTAAAKARADALLVEAERKLAQAEARLKGPSTNTEPPSTPDNPPDDVSKGRKPLFKKG